MPRGDIHNRIEQVENINKRISLSQEISLNNKLTIAELDRFNVGVRDVGPDRRVRELESLFYLSRYIGDDWDLDKPTKEHVENLIIDIKQGKVTDTDNPSVGQINEFKKTLNKLYHSRSGDQKSLMKYKDPEYNGSEIATYTYTTRKKSIDPETVLRPEDVAKLLECCSSPRDKAYIMLMWGTAGRVGEVLGIKWRDVELGTVHGNEIAKVRIKEADNARQEKTNTRKVPLREGYTFLQKLKDHDPLSNNPDAFLFRGHNSMDPEGQLSYAGASGIVSRALKKVKEREDMTWNPNRKTNNHNFRHSRATYWASKGMNESQIRALGGWSDSSDTVKHYIHLGREDVEGAVLDFHGLERDEDAEEFSLEPFPCPECGKLNPFNSTNCQNPKCGVQLDMKSQAQEIQVDETAKQVAMDVASSTGKITQEQIQRKAEELVQERMNST